ncbi:hypothetical protein HML84_04845 [Alcanivorax sp. IO_7]|nr:hypothetical protein HML84_04845 [Alcanivorax sp. IO_7]
MLSQDRGLFFVHQDDIAPLDAVPDGQPPKPPLGTDDVQKIVTIPDRRMLIGACGWYEYTRLWPAYVHVQLQGM